MPIVALSYSNFTPRQLILYPVSSTRSSQRIPSIDSSVHLRQIESEVQLRGARQPNQDDLLAKERLLLDRMLERAQTEVKIIGPLSAMDPDWRVDSSASTEPRSSWVEDPNKSSTLARRSESYSSCSEDILEHSLDAVIGYRNW